MKLLGVERILSASAVGSLQEQYAPLDMVIPDQFLTGRARAPANQLSSVKESWRTWPSPHPVCGELGDVLEEACKVADVKSAPARNLSVHGRAGVFHQSRV